MRRGTRARPTRSPNFDDAAGRKSQKWTAFYHSGLSFAFREIFATVEPRCVQVAADVSRIGDLHRMLGYFPSGPANASGGG